MNKLKRRNFLPLLAFDLIDQKRDAMIEAMYGVEFESDYESGYGVAVFETGRIFGGDSSFVFIGTYRIDGARLIANLSVTNDREVLPSIVGLNNFRLVGEADIGKDANHKEFILHATVVGNPSVRITVKLTRRAELP